MNLTNAGTRYEQRDIVLIPFPFSDLSFVKQRPSLIISNEEFKGNDLICCLITSNSLETTNSINITETDMEEGKLYYKSRIKPGRIFTISKDRVIKSIAKLNMEKYNEVKKEIEKIIKEN